MGNIGFDAGYYPQNSPFSKAIKHERDCMEQLNDVLDDKGKELLEQFCNAQEEVEEITHYNTFTQTLKFGVLLMAEIFMGEGQAQ